MTNRVVANAYKGIPRPQVIAKAKYETAIVVEGQTITPGSADSVSRHVNSVIVEDILKLPVVQHR